MVEYIVEAISTLEWPANATAITHVLSVRKAIVPDSRILGLLITRLKYTVTNTKAIQSRFRLAKIGNGSDRRYQAG